MTNETQELAGNAQILLNNPAYRQAIVRIKANIFDKWCQSGLFMSRRKRERLWDMMQAALDFEKELESMIADAEFDKKHQSRMEKIHDIKHY